MRETTATPLDRCSVPSDSNPLLLPKVDALRFFVPPCIRTQANPKALCPFINLRASIAPAVSFMILHRSGTLD